MLDRPEHRSPWKCGGRQAFSKTLTHELMATGSGAIVNEAEETREVMRAHAVKYDQLSLAAKAEYEEVARVHAREQVQAISAQAREAQARRRRVMEEEKEPCVGTIHRTRLRTFALLFVLAIGFTKQSGFAVAAQHLTPPMGNRTIISPFAEVWNYHLSHALCHFLRPHRPCVLDLKNIFLLS